MAAIMFATEDLTLKRLISTFNSNFISNFIVVAVVAVVGAAVILGAAPSSKAASDADLARLAKCISSSGATFYGAHWCGYCRKQKAMFGDAAKFLPYVECYVAGTKNKLSKCDAVSGFPSWKFANGKSGGGMMSLEALAGATGCSAP
ncbi:MAG: thiol-disulfide isomerase/thioredoxin [Hyphomicrobiaceae bacterium]|jgi:thiol-disulfide isomerase/thioredoxin